MKRVLVAGAGGAPSEGVIRSLIRSNLDIEVVGMGSEPSDLALSAAAKRYHVPYANSPDYRARLLEVLAKVKPDLVHFQNDLEVYHASILRDDILSTGASIFMPRHEVIDKCVHKYKTYLCFKQAGVIVPENIMIRTEGDLDQAFSRLADDQGRIWLRSATIGGGGKGAIPTASASMARAWIEHHSGWGEFVAASMLESETVTWLSIWHEGELVVAQSRARQAWTHGNRTVSGVTGVTKVGLTCDDAQVNDVALRSVYAVDPRPHGIYGVDMAYDQNGVPNPTEINISRFFTTVLFFTEAGLNMPEVFVQLGTGGALPNFGRKVNPLPSGLLWLRGMDVSPRLTTDQEIEDQIEWA